MTAVAHPAHLTEGRAKIEIALAKGKKIYDERESIKAQDAEREARTTVRRAERRYGKR